MPAAYFIAQVDVFNPQDFEPYRTRTPETISKYGGEYVVRGGEYEVLEGETPLPRQVIIRFPDKAAAQAWYGSDDYRELLALRKRCAVTNMVLVEGIG